MDQAGAPIQPSTTLSTDPCPERTTWCYLLEGQDGNESWAYQAFRADTLFPSQLVGIRREEVAFCEHSSEYPGLVTITWEPQRVYKASSPAEEHLQEQMLTRKHDALILFDSVRHHHFAPDRYPNPLAPSTSPPHSMVYGRAHHGPGGHGTPASNGDQPYNL